MRRGTRADGPSLDRNALRIEWLKSERWQCAKNTAFRFFTIDQYTKSSKIAPFRPTTSPNFRTFPKTSGEDFETYFFLASDSIRQSSRSERRQSNRIASNEINWHQIACLGGEASLSPSLTHQIKTDQIKISNQIKSRAWAVRDASRSESCFTRCNCISSRANAASSCSHSEMSPWEILCPCKNILLWVIHEV